MDKKKDELNSLYKSALLFEGKFENDKIIYNKYRAFCINLTNLILYIVILSHLIIFVTDLDIFKDHLIYFKFSQLNDFGSRIMNFGLIYIKLFVSILKINSLFFFIQVQEQ